MSYTRYEVRTKGDGEFDYFIHPSDPEAENEANYNETNPEEARAYAEALDGWVVEITEKEVGRKAPPPPDLTIELYDIKKTGEAYLICRQMKCDYPVTDIGKAVHVLVAEWQDLRDAYRGADEHGVAAVEESGGGTTYTVVRGHSVIVD